MLKNLFDEYFSNLSWRCAVVVAGPSASGKSDFAVKMAKRYGGMIVNADSMQLYRGLPLLTAQPSKKDQAVTPHALYGTVAYDDKTVSVARWLEWVQAIRIEAGQSKQRLWIVGGTGFYLKMLLSGGPCWIPSIDRMKKVEIEHNLKKESLETLRKTLDRYDPDFIAPDKQRLIRALSVYYLTGKPLSFWQKTYRAFRDDGDAAKDFKGHPFKAHPSSFFNVLIWPSKALLAQRIARRFDGLLQQNLCQEVQNFLALPNASQSPLRQAIGLQVVAQYNQGLFSLEKCRELYEQSVRRYVKRQRTWFRHQYSPHVIVSGDTIEWLA